MTDKPMSATFHESDLGDLGGADLTAFALDGFLLLYKPEADRTEIADALERIREDGYEAEIRGTHSLRIEVRLYPVVDDMYCLTFTKAPRTAAL